MTPPSRSKSRPLVSIASRRLSDDAATGEVLAVINMVLVKGSKESAITHPSGISYAIPVRFVRELVKDR